MAPARRPSAARTTSSRASPATSDGRSRRRSRTSGDPPSPRRLGGALDPNALTTSEGWEHYARGHLHHGNVFSPLGWANFLDEIPHTVNRHKPYGAFSVMTPELMRGFARRAGLEVVDCRTDALPRDAITLLRKPD